jgi:hypothetical protein
VSSPVALPITLIGAPGEKYVTVKYTAGDQELIITKHIKLVDTGTIPFVVFGTACDSANIPVQTINNTAQFSTLLTTNNYNLPGNTVYVLNEGNYPGNQKINLT